MCRNSLLGSGTRRVSQSHGAYVPVVEGRGQKKKGKQTHNIQSESDGPREKNRQN